MCKSYWQPNNDDLKSDRRVYKSCRRCRKPELTAEEIREVEMKDKDYIEQERKHYMKIKKIIFIQNAPIYKLDILNACHCRLTYLLLLTLTYLLLLTYSYLLANSTYSHSFLCIVRVCVCVCVCVCVLVSPQASSQLLREPPTRARC